MSGNLAQKHKLIRHSNFFHLPLLFPCCQATCFRCSQAKEIATMPFSFQKQSDFGPLTSGCQLKIEVLPKCELVNNYLSIK